MSLVLSVVLFVSGSAFQHHTGSGYHSGILWISAMTSSSMSGTWRDSELLPLYDRLKSADGVYKSMYQTVPVLCCRCRCRQFVQPLSGIQRRRSSRTGRFICPWISSSSRTVNICVLSVNWDCPKKLHRAGCGFDCRSQTRGPAQRREAGKSLIYLKSHP